MTRGGIAIVGAAETDLGVLPGLPEPDLHARAAALALADAGLTPADVDGIATAWHSPVDIAHHLGITPSWHDGTTVGGCSFLVHVRHAAAAIEAGLCTTVLVLHGESGRSRVGRPSRRPPADSPSGQFEAPYGVRGAVTAFTLPALRFLHETGTAREQMAAVPAVQSRWAHGNPRAWRGEEFTVEDVLASKVVAWPFRKLECCPVTDGGAALVLTSADRAADLPRPPVHLLGAGEAGESPLVAHMEDLTSSGAFRRSSRAAFAEAGITKPDVTIAWLDRTGRLALTDDEKPGLLFKREWGEEKVEAKAAVAEWLKTDDGKGFVPAANTQGTGDGPGKRAPAHSSGQPVSVDTLSRSLFNRALG